MFLETTRHAQKIQKKLLSKETDKLNIQGTNEKFIAAIIILYIAVIIKDATTILQEVNKQKYYSMWLNSC